MCGVQILMVDWLILISVLFMLLQELTVFSVITFGVMIGADVSQHTKLVILISCLACSSACSTGLRRCTSPFSDGCCLFFYPNGQCTSDDCTVSSGPNYIATASNNFICSEFGIILIIIIMFTLLACNYTCPVGHIVNGCSECIFTSICERDRPCHNGGNCIQYSPATNYTCDCTGTGYEGVNCTTGE